MDGDNLKLFGFYRARVTQVDIPDYKLYGAVRIFVPDIMTELDTAAYDEEAMGLIAFPANNPLGGRNIQQVESHATGTVYIPRKGSWVWAFFEGGSPNRPFYWNGIDINNTPLPPENLINIEGEEIEEPHRVYTVLKTYAGRAIVVSDDENTQRIEISGKKANINSEEEPTGAADVDAVYGIDDIEEGGENGSATKPGNMTTILFDERTGKEKILIRTRLGDFFHVDVDEQELQMYFKKDIKIQTDGNLYIKVAKNMEANIGEELHFDSTAATFVKSEDVINMESALDMNLKTDTKLNAMSTDDMSIKTEAKLKVESASDMDIKSGGTIRKEATTDINIKAGNDINGNAGNDVSIKGENNSTLEAVATATVKGDILSLQGDSGAGVITAGNFDTEAGGDTNIKSTGKVNVEGTDDVNVLSAAATNLTGSTASVKGSSNLALESAHIDINGEARGNDMQIDSFRCGAGKCPKGVWPPCAGGSGNPGSATAATASTGDPPEPTPSTDTAAAQSAPEAATAEPAEPILPVGDRES